MTARDFCYWLQGYFEIEEVGLNGGKKNVAEQHLIGEKVDVIRRHLTMVFQHEIDPSFGGAKEQAVLNDLHTKKIRC